MKNEQVVPDYWVMLKSSATCLLLAFSGFVLLKMVQAIFWLPGYLEANQKKLEELAASYTDQLTSNSNDTENIEEKTTEEKSTEEKTIPDEAKKEK